MRGSRVPILRVSTAALAPLLFGLSALLGSGAALTAEPHRDSVVARGDHLARIVCSACHVVAKDQEYPPILDTPGPAFYDIANRPTTTEESLRHFIKTTHWDMKTIPMTMPNPMLTPEDIRAVARYIMSLRAK